MFKDRLSLYVIITIIFSILLPFFIINNFIYSFTCDEEITIFFLLIEFYSSDQFLEIIDDQFGCGCFFKESCLFDGIVGITGELFPYILINIWEAH